MSWYRDDDGKIITDEEFQSDCMECACFCQEGTINIHCNGERTDCPYFKEVDTSEYDKKIRAKAIDEFADKIIEAYSYIPKYYVRALAEQLKGDVNVNEEQTRF